MVVQLLSFVFSGDPQAPFSGDHQPPWLYHGMVYVLHLKTLLPTYKLRPLLVPFACIYSLDWKFNKCLSWGFPFFITHFLR